MSDPFKDLVWDSLIKAALSLIPFFSIPIVGPLVGAFVGIFADKLYELIKDAINLQAIAFKNKKLEEEFNVAAVKLKLLANGQGIDSPAFLEAREEHKKRLRALVSLKPG